MSVCSHVRECRRDGASPSLRESHVQACEGHRGQLDVRDTMGRDRVGCIETLPSSFPGQNTSEYCGHWEPSVCRGQGQVCEDRGKLPCL